MIHTKYNDYVQSTNEGFLMDLVKKLFGTLLNGVDKTYQDALSKFQQSIEGKSKNPAEAVNLLNKFLQQTQTIFKEDLNNANDIYTIRQSVKDAMVSTYVTIFDMKKEFKDQKFTFTDVFANAGETTKKLFTSKDAKTFDANFPKYVNEFIKGEAGKIGIKDIPADFDAASKTQMIDDAAKKQAKENTSTAAQPTTSTAAQPTTSTAAQPTTSTAAQPTTSTAASPTNKATNQQDVSQVESTKVSNLDSKLFEADENKQYQNPDLLKRLKERIITWFDGTFYKNIYAYNKTVAGEKPGANDQEIDKLAKQIKASPNNAETKKKMLNYILNIDNTQQLIELRDLIARQNNIKDAKTEIGAL